MVEVSFNFTVLGIGTTKHQEITLSITANLKRLCIDGITTPSTVKRNRTKILFPNTQDIRRHWNWRWQRYRCGQSFISHAAPSKLHL
ncbi:MULTISPECIES: hypothetical protein [unclassified Leptolyngbya]|uniref:hypothetical protein n=1 Tax=unclassified Leptolyngbya TaxID=2650499 RepID=UPI001688C2E2|nr:MULTISPECIES: hypothetical protein [unclassified Leptolyngbya]MBD1910408.1 hypothetical protein [Leptolyngbya sp. FACHB-8]MBD2157804.1 hypothetical protein [Leptolyngbya sp. FACHB-16]